MNANIMKKYDLTGHRYIGNSLSTRSTKMFFMIISLKLRLTFKTVFFGKNMNIIPYLSPLSILKITSNFSKNAPNV